jgi:formylglycine-generating enzyme required for sulfatase activity
MKKPNPISDEQDIIRVEMSYRVVRGGSWYRSAERTRSSFRGYGGRSISNYTLGFRLVKNK